MFNHIACILDEFSYLSFGPECSMTNLPSEGWREQLEARRPDFLFVESAFFGHDGNWHGLIAHPHSTPANPFLELMRYCGDRNIPRVFWNKDDPVRFDDFIDTAREADHIFTTDSNQIQKYRDSTSAQTVNVLPFAVQPRTTDRVTSAPSPARRGSVCFPGSWYRRYPERRKDLKVLLKAAQPFGLHIFDRNEHHANRRQVTFPWRFRKNIVGSVAPAAMPDLYRSYDVVLNVNTVTDSPTMVSRRVLEALACGTAVLSNRAQGLTGLFGHDVVPAAATVREAREQLALLLGDPQFRKSAVARAREIIMTRHLCRHRLETIRNVLDDNTMRFEESID